MADTAAYLTDDVLPEVPYRQWVFTVPFRIRYAIAFDKGLCGDVKRIFIRTVMEGLLRQGKRGICSTGGPDAGRSLLRVQRRAVRGGRGFHASCQCLQKSCAR